VRTNGSFGPWLKLNMGGVELLTAHDPVDVLTAPGQADALEWWAS